MHYKRFHRMVNTLFRPEVMHAKQASWLGGIRIGHNPRFGIVASLALVLAACLITFAVWGQVARKSRIPGVLMPLQGTVQLSANAPGVLTEQWVEAFINFPVVSVVKKIWHSIRK